MQLTVTPQISGSHADLRMSLGEIIAQTSSGESVLHGYSKRTMSMLVVFVHEMHTGELYG